MRAYRLKPGVIIHGAAGSVTRMDSFAYDHNLPCLNPNCKSHGRPHANCRCYAGAEHAAAPLGSGEYAKGGEVHYCAHGMPHHESCEHYADGGQVELNHQTMVNPDLAVDHMIAECGLHHALTKTGMSRSPDKTMASQQFIEHSKKGAEKTERVSKDLLSKHEHPSDSPGVEALRSHLDNVRLNPSQLLNVGGSLGETLPSHANALAAKTAKVVNYLQAIRPQGTQNTPLDRIIPPSKERENEYNRQLHVAQNPLSVTNSIKKGTVKPDDLVTLKTLYPALHQSLVNGAGRALIDARTGDKQVTYRQKQGLSALFGQPVDSSQTLVSMQAIIKANGGPQQPQPQSGKPQKQRSGSKAPTAATQKTLEKTDELYETPLDQLQTRKR
jgi:hypothetical protein